MDVRLKINCYLSREGKRAFLHSRKGHHQRKARLTKGLEGNTPFCGKVIESTKQRCFQTCRGIKLVLHLL